MAEDTLRGRLVSFVFTSVLAGLVTTTFTYKSWREQTRLDLAKSRLAEATKTFDRASQLMSARTFYSFRVSHGIAGDDNAAFAVKLEKLDKAVEDWNLAYADMLQDFQFALEIDESGAALLYHEIRTGAYEKRLKCDQAFVDGNGPIGADWSSPSVLLSALNFCFIEAHVPSTAVALRAKTTSPSGKATTAQTISDAAADAAKGREQLEETIDALQTHCDAVRVAGKRAIQRLRNATATHSFGQFLRSW